jgi:predicted O-methyltransferase YrrM
MTFNFLPFLVVHLSLSVDKEYFEIGVLIGFVTIDFSCEE